MNNFDQLNIHVVHTCKIEDETHGHATEYRSRCSQERDTPVGAFAHRTPSGNQTRGVRAEWSKFRGPGITTAAGVVALWWCGGAARKTGQKLSIAMTKAMSQ